MLRAVRDENKNLNLINEVFLSAKLLVQYSEHDDEHE